MTRRFAFLTGRTFRGTPMAPGQVPPPTVKETALIHDACAEEGIAFDIVYWDEPDLAHRDYSFALIRTCWDYTERADEFVRTLEAHERAGLRVFNPSSVIRWNARKTYLKDLGAAAIETVWADKVTPDVIERAFNALGAAEIVVKPQVGAGSIATVRLKRSEWRERDLAAGPPGAAMIQAFLRSIETEGERSLFWFGGQFSHAIRKVPESGDWLANIPGKTRFVSEAPPPDAMQVAEAARAAAPEGLLQVRIDLVLGDDGHWRVIEIEAIEPYLFLDFAPDGARVLAKALAGVFSG